MAGGSGWGVCARALVLLCVAGCGSQRERGGASVANDPAMKLGQAKLVLAHALGQGTAQQATSQPNGTRATSTPYAGDLSIFDYPDRDGKLQIGRVMKLLGIGPGKRVADIGAGSGWFTVRAARKVGPTGTVFAEDINPAAMTFIDQRAAKEKLKNVQTVLGTTDDPKLPPESVDAVLILKTYHEFGRPVELMERVRRALRPGALVGIIDRNGNGSGQDHGVPMATVQREMHQAGFEEVKMYDFTKADGQDYFLIFRAQ